MNTYTGFYLITALAVSLMIALLHYWSPSKLHPILRYIMGTLAINLPVTIALIFWQAWTVLVLLWIAVAAAGLTTAACYLVDHWRQIGPRLSVSEHEGEYLREAIDGEKARQF